MTTLYATEIEYSPQNKDTSTVIVALGFDITVGQKEDRENDHDDVPTGEDQAEIHLVQCQFDETVVRGHT